MSGWSGPVRDRLRRWAPWWMGAIALVLLLPGLGSGLWDPWETHYAEVARRVAQDGDWVTLRWGNPASAPDDVGRDFLFFSKPALTFWLMALSFLVFGVSEAAARLPMVLLTAGGVAASVFYLRRLVSDRAAATAGAALLLTPMVAMLGKHAMTDVPFVMPMTVGILAFAAVILDDRTSPRHAYVGYVCLGLATLAKGLLGFLLPGAVLAILLLLRFDASPWRAGPAGEAPARSWRRGLLAALLVFAVLTLAAGAAWAIHAASRDVIEGGRLVRGARMPWSVVWASAMRGAKWGGAAGAALVAVVLLLLGSGGRAGRLRLPTGVPLFLGVCALWYGPVIAEHGMRFVREFFLLHHFGRAASGQGLDLSGLDLHDGSAGYYLQQASYAVFPFLALLPAALVAWLRDASAERPAGAEEAAAADRSAGLLALLVAWVAVTVVLFTFTDVKFHHYLFPAVPALAMLAGIGGDALRRRGAGGVEVAALVIGGALAFAVWRELAQDPHRLIRLFSYRYGREFPPFGWMSPVLAVTLGLAMAGAVAGALGAAFGARGLGRVARAAGGLPLVGGVAAAAVLTSTAAWFHMPEMDRWISQRRAFAALAAEPRQEGDRLVSWQNNWRGEVFYSHDAVTVFPPRDPQKEEKLRTLLRSPGRTFFVTADLRNLRAAVGRIVGPSAAREHLRELTRGEGTFAAAVYEGPAAGSYEPRIAALPGDVAVPPGAAGVAVVLSEPNGPGRLAVLGSRAARRVVRGGEASVIEVFLRCDARARAAWDVFLHLDAPPPDRRPRAANGDHGFAGGRVPTSACRPGELLVDRWDLEIPDGAAEGTYQLFFGLWSPQGGARMTVAPSFATVSPGSEGIAMPEEYRDRVYLGDLIVTR